MSIVFLILKILGILLLIPVIVILILLICPIFYQLEGDFDGKSPHFKAKVSWALVFFRMWAAYKDDIEFTVRIFGVPVYRTDSEKWSLLGGVGKKKSVVEERTAKKAEDTRTDFKNSLKKDVMKKEAEELKLESIQEQKKTTQDVLELSWDEPEEILLSHTTSKKEKKKKRKFSGEKIVDYLKKCYNKCRNIIGKLKQIFEKVEEFQILLEDEKILAALSRLKKYGMDGLKYLFPQRLEGDLVFGLEDPALTGKILGCLAAAMPIYGEHLNITPDFDQNILKGHILAAGRIRRYKLLKLAWDIYRDKDLLKQKDRVAEMIGG